MMGAHKQSEYLHMNTSSLITKNTFCRLIARTPNGLARLIATDPSAPKPIKFGNSKQASVYFDAQEVELYINSKKAARGIQCISGEAS